MIKEFENDLSKKREAFPRVESAEKGQTRGVNFILGWPFLY